MIAKTQCFRLKTALRRYGVVFAALFVAALMAGCTRNTNPPSYIKDLVWYVEGDGVVVYFILADDQGQMTASDGKATVKIWGGDGYRNGLPISFPTVYEQSRTVAVDDFQKTKVGLGAFEHEVYAYVWGRISKSDMGLPQGYEYAGKIQLDFYPATPLEGKEHLTAKDSCTVPE